MFAAAAGFAYHGGLACARQALASKDVRPNDAVTAPYRSFGGFLVMTGDRYGKKAEAAVPATKEKEEDSGAPKKRRRVGAEETPQERRLGFTSELKVAGEKWPSAPIADEDTMRYVTERASREETIHNLEEGLESPALSSLMRFFGGTTTDNNLRAIAEEKAAMAAEEATDSSFLATITSTVMTNLKVADRKSSLFGLRRLNAGDTAERVGLEHFNAFVHLTTQGFSAHTIGEVQNYYMRTMTRTLAPMICGEEAFEANKGYLSKVHGWSEQPIKRTMAMSMPRKTGKSYCTAIAIAGTALTCPGRSLDIWAVSQRASTDLLLKAVKLIEQYILDNPGTRARVVYKKSENIAFVTSIFEHAEPFTMRAMPSNPDISLPSYSIPPSRPLPPSPLFVVQQKAPHHPRVPSPRSAYASSSTPGPIHYNVIYTMINLRITYVTC